MHACVQLPLLYQSMTIHLCKTLSVFWCNLSCRLGYKFFREYLTVLFEYFNFLQIRWQGTASIWALSGLPLATPLFETNVSHVLHVIAGCVYFSDRTKRGVRKRGCNLVRLACNPNVIFRNLCNL